MTDLATMDGEGYLNIVGRIKDMIIRGGENVNPREIEEFLYGQSRRPGCPGDRRAYKVPRYVKFVDGFPMTVTGKVQKFLTREASVKELGLDRAAVTRMA